MLLVVGLAGALAGGCATLAYEPLRLPLERSLAPGEFERAVDTLRADYPSLAVEATALRARSQWERCEDRGWPARRRLAVFVEDGGRSLGVVVEVQHYRIGFGGMPEWTEVEGHARFERQVVDRLRETLGA